MIRNLKLLGLVLGAVFALNALAASSAFAQEGVVTVEGGGAATLKGTETGTPKEKNFFEARGVKVTCEGSTYTGHETGSTINGVPNLATSATITPDYTNCSSPVDMNGCDYKLYDVTTTGGVAGTYGPKIDIACTGTNKIKVTVPFCTVEIGPQTGLTGFHLTNTAAPPGGVDDIDMTGVITNLAAKDCFGATTAKQEVDVTIKGFNSSGVQKGITISE